MDFKENNSCVYFFVDNKGSVRINKMNNSEEDVKSLYFERHDSAVLLFAYDYYRGILYVTNVDEENLSDVLEVKRTGGTSDIFVKQILDQMEIAGEYLKNTYQWSGTIEVGNPPHDAIFKMSIKDYAIAWDFLETSLLNLNFEAINLDVYVISELGTHSVFVDEEEVYETSRGDIPGPAILINKVNGTLSSNRNIVYQYYVNLADLYNFDAGDYNSYVYGVSDYLDEMFEGYLNNNSVAKKTDWYVFARKGQVFIERNERGMKASDISKTFGSYKAVMNFGYVGTEDGGYIIVDEISMENSREGVYHDLYNAIMDNLTIIGHVDEEGVELKEAPLVLFDDNIESIRWEDIKETPVWAYIVTVLSKCYGFDQANIPVLRGNFKGDFAAVYISEVNDSNKDAISKYINIEEAEAPFIMWNDSYGKKESFVGSFHSLINEYLKFISDLKGISMSRISDETTDGIQSYLEYLNDEVLGKNIFMFENEMLLSVEFSKYYHEYNFFMFMFDILSFDRGRIEKALSETPNGEESEHIAELADSVHQKAYYVMLKVSIILAGVKYGEDVISDEDIINGDLVIKKNFGGNIMRVVEIVMDDENSKLYKCLDLVGNNVSSFTFEDLDNLDLVFYDSKDGKARIATASKDEPNNYYKKLLTKWLRNPIVQKMEGSDWEEVPQGNSMESMLREQNEYFEHHTDEILTEVLLNENRKARNG
jgi:hypothetical protein